ncbi:MAG: glycosyltransferase family 2 protein [Sphingomonas sp.]
METNRQVCAVVLTYNRRDMLERCLAALVAQTRRCDRIVVVDNASGDGTAAMLAERWGDSVEVYSLRKNIGAAGGFNLGMHIAYRVGADFVWAMDDDVIAAPDALEELLVAQRLLAGHGVAPPYLVSVPRSTTGQLTEMPDIDRRRNVLGFPAWAEWLEHGLAPTLGATFASILLPRETLREHGLPVASMFIFGEDREFTVRVTRERPGFLVARSHVLHARKLEGALDTRTEANPVRLTYHYYLHRNTTSTVLSYDDWSLIVLHFMRQTRLFAGLLMRARLRRAWIVGWGTLSGIFYRPRPQRADGPLDLDRLRGTEPPASLPASNEIRPIPRLRPVQEPATQR